MSSLLYDRKNKKTTEISQYGGGMMQAAFRAGYSNGVTRPSGGGLFKK